MIRRDGYPPRRLLQKKTLIILEGEKRMKKLATLVFALLLGVSLSFAQADSGKKADDTTKSDSKGDKKDKKKKGSKKSKKGDKGADTTAAPK
jgi:hypothetical protein